MRVDLGEDAVEGGGGVGLDLEADVGRVVLPLADAKVLDLVDGPAGEDGVEHLGQQQRVDDVAGHLDVFDVGAGHGASGGRSGGRAVWYSVLIPVREVGNETGRSRITRPSESGK